jgi:hypothetical protein
MGYERSFHQAVGGEAASKMTDLMQHEAATPRSKLRVFVEPSKICDLYRDDKRPPGTAARASSRPQGERFPDKGDPPRDVWGVSLALLTGTAGLLALPQDRKAASRADAK